VRLDFV
jgi:hypothetical protein